MYNHLDWFRSCAPYINLHRDKVVVVHLSSSALCGVNSETLYKDIALLHSLSLKLILVFQSSATDDPGSTSHILTSEQLGSRAFALKQQQMVLESSLVSANALTPNFSLPIRVVSGTFVTAKPQGVINGVDLGHFGTVRRIDHQGICQQLSLGNVVLLSPLAGSPTGELFYVDSRQLACECAMSTGASKLIYIDEGQPPLTTGENAYNLSGAQVQSLLNQNTEHPPEVLNLLKLALKATDNKVERVHFLNSKTDGALLSELFTTDGSGLMISGGTYEQQRQATINDAVQIIALLKPMENQGYIVERTQDIIEREISRFTVIERDGSVIGCVALHPFIEERVGEVYSLGVKEAYRQNARGSKLLDTIESQARSLGLKRLFLLTTQSTHWFIEHGFNQAKIEDLPVARQNIYNYQRNSKVLIKKLS